MQRRRAYLGDADEWGVSADTATIDPGSQVVIFDSGMTPQVIPDTQGTDPFGGVDVSAGNSGTPPYQTVPATDSSGFKIPDSVVNQIATFAGKGVDAFIAYQNRQAAQANAGVTTKLPGGAIRLPNGQIIAANSGLIRTLNAPAQSSAAMSAQLKSALPYAVAGVGAFLLVKMVNTKGRK